ncbi:XdhC family protein [Alkalicoccobacillus gibsonii]|uniref:XdhC family protein n=1 Tax=Alkalicoccobacillus gibsonii TaxID=79881 RepID=A0ABU9VLB8_9BACI
MDDIHVMLDHLDQLKLPAFLATIVQVEGSAYKKESACMLIQGDGESFGFISAGCLEQDLIERVKRGEGSQIVVYDMSTEDDLSFGASAGCNGIIHVLLERIDSLYLTHLQRVKSLVQSGKEVLLVKDLLLNSYLCIPEGEEPFGRASHFSSLEIKNVIHQASSSGKTSKRVYTHEGNPVFTQQINPKPRLLLFGAGEDAFPLVSLAADTGFNVIVSDWRQSLCTVERFPKAIRVLHGFPHEVVQTLDVRSNDFIILMTHHFEHDQTLLKLLRGRRLAFLGVLGSAKRTARLLEQQEVPTDVRSPVGLSIGAQGATEIAVSIVAELIQVVRSNPSTVNKELVG